MSSGISGSCGTYATSVARSLFDIAARSRPSTRIEPSWGTSPASARNSDDLPAPFGPITPSHSPDSTRSLNGCTTTRSS